MWSVKYGHCLFTKRRHTTPVHMLASLDGGLRVVSGSEEGAVYVWCLKSGACVRSLQGHTQRVRCALVSEASEAGVLVTGSADNQCLVSVW